MTVYKQNRPTVRTVQDGQGYVQNLQHVPNIVKWEASWWCYTVPFKYSENDQT